MNQIHSTFKKGLLNSCNIIKNTNSIKPSSTLINRCFVTIPTTQQINHNNKSNSTIINTTTTITTNSIINNFNNKRNYTNIGSTPPNRQPLTSTTATLDKDVIEQTTTTAAAPESTTTIIVEELIKNQENEKEQEGNESNKQESSSSSSSSSSTLNFKKIITISILSILAIGTKLVIDPPNDIDKLDFAFIRNLRVMYTGFKITFYYKYYLNGLNRGDPEFTENIAIAHKLAAEAMVTLCLQNKGIFIKVAQILASLDHILPQQYIKQLSIFQDHAPYVTFDEVVKLFKIETNGKHPDDIFIDFERSPINSASLAQVHKAKLLLDPSTGEVVEVAVKVQYPGLKDKFQKDMDSLDNVLTYITMFFPSFQFSWILGEATSCLIQELDFINEGKNSEKMAEIFKGNNQLTIPKVYWPQTTKRILTMEFIHGVRIDDKQGLDKLGINLKELYYLFSDIFAHQIFCSGWLHSDPHPGNLFVRKTVDGKPNLVLLDHGLYKKIDDNVRLDFCHLWKSLCLGDIKSSEYYAERLGAGVYSKHLGILLNLKPEKSRENLRNMKRELGDQTLIAINEILKNLPKEILLVLKTNNLIRQVTTHFGIENGFLTMAKTCIKGIYIENDIWTRLKYYFTLCIFNIEIKLIDFIKRRNPPPQPILPVGGSFHH